MLLLLINIIRKNNFIFQLFSLVFYFLIENVSTIKGDININNSIDKIIKPNKLLIITATTTTTTNPNNNEAFIRFNKSVEAFNLKLIVLGVHEEWIKEKFFINDNNHYRRNEIVSYKTKNGNLRKIDLLKKALRTYKDEKDLLILWLEEPNSFIINGNDKQILNRFNSLFNHKKILFSLNEFENSFCSKQNCDNNYSTFIGQANLILNLLENNTKERDIFNSLIQLDYKSKLFQNINSKLSENDLELEFNNSTKSSNDSDKVKLKNILHNSEPLIIFGNNDIKSNIMLNSLGNYLGKAWTLNGGCRDCNDSSLIKLSKISKNEYPVVLIGLFIEEPTPFIEDFFETVILLDYPREKIHLFLHNSVEFHNKQVDDFFNNKFNNYFLTQEIINNIKVDNIRDEEFKAREYCLEKCVKLSCDYYLSLDSIARLDNENSLKILIELNKTILAPLLVKTNKLWSNFWGSINNYGYYLRSFDYIDLVKRERLGIWNVPHIMNAYLIKGSFLKEKLNYKYYNINKGTIIDIKPEHLFSLNLRLRKDFSFMFMTNLDDFGHLVDSSDYNVSLKNPDFYQLKHNMLDWEQKYLNDNYSLILEDENYKLEQPCQDVFWFPLVNDKFCNDLIEIMETFNQWSGGTSDDPRIEGGYESVPTRDIHLKQVQLHDMWLLFLREYVMPIQLKEYIGYEHDPPRADLAFVVRYHPSEQASLRPHHDSSTYTMNIALNTPGIDYQGGGCNFVRYNCSVVESRKGWALLHPGRLTHYHEGLTVTNGTRYILVTFIDP